MSDANYPAVDTQDATFAIERSFAAPPELIYQVWTDVEHLKKWWGPKGFQIKSLTVDLQPGGLFHYCLLTPEGEELWGRIAYSKIVSPERLEFLFSFSDEFGNKTRNPMAPDWPIEVHNTVSFEEFGDGTKFSLTAIPINATEAESQAFSGALEAMRQGWEGTLEQLETYLVTLIAKA